jgi:DNA repair exonuclease SbcCD ATPase subunit
VKVLAFSDVHLDDAVDPSGVQAELFKSTSEWLASLIREHQPSIVVNLGDTNHRDGGMTVGTIRLLKEFYSTLNAAIEGNRIFTIVGNHDQHSRNGELHVLEQLKWLSNVIDVPVVEEIEGKRILFAPYLRDGDEYMKRVAPLRPFDVVFTHMDIVGARMNSSIKSSHGLGTDWHPAIFNGHYHCPQEVGNVTVIGAPQYRHFGDVDPAGTPARGAALIEIGQGRPRVTRLANPHTKVFAKFKARTAGELRALYGAWRQEVEAKPERQNLWFVGPSPALSELREDDWAGTGLVRYTPNDSAKVEETSITLDLTPETALRQYAEDAPCSCGGQHDVEFGVSLLRTAEDYTVSRLKGRSVEFLDMTVSDFMSFGKVTLDLANRGLTLIEGVNLDDPSVESNGSGKSGIAEAMLWALFDKTSRGIKADEVIRRGAKKAEVRLHFKVDGSDYVVTRVRSKGKPSAHVEENGVDVTPHDQREVNTMVERLLGTTFEVFLLTVVLAQGFESKFSSLGDTSRKEMLESFLGIEVYDQAKLAVSRQVKDLRSKLTELTLAINRAEAAAEAARQSRDRAVRARDEASRQTSRARAEVEAALAGYETLMAGQRQDASGCKRAEDEAWEALQKARNGLMTLRQRQMKGEVAITSQRALLEAKTTEMSHLQSGLNCSACGQPVPPDVVQSRLQQVGDEIEAATSRMALLETTMEGVVSGIASAKAEEDEATLAWEEARKRTTESALILQTTEVELRQLRKEYDSLTPKLDHFDSLIAEAIARVQEYEGVTVHSNTQKKSVDIQLHECEYWETAFDPTGIRSVLLRTVVNYVNEYLHEMCVVVTGGSFLVQLSSTKELKSKKESVNKLDIVVTPEGSYRSGSGGERRKIDILLNTAVSRLARQTSGFSSNLLIADEVLDNLDLTASQHVLQMFEATAQQGSSVFLISHNPAVKPLVPSVVTVVKQGGVSLIQ